MLPACKLSLVGNEIFAMRFALVESKKVTVMAGNCFEDYSVVCIVL